MVEAQSQEQEPADKLAKLKTELDDVADKLKKSGILMVELREAVSRAKKFAIDEFKSSSEFLESVEDAASKYFDEGFDLCKWQLCHHHPDVGINLEDMGLDHDLLDEEAKGNEGERENANNEDNGRTESPPP